MNNEALTEHLFDLNEKLAILPLIHSEVKRTNGRVTDLERATAEMSKLVSHHSGKFEQMVVEHRATLSLIESKEKSFIAALEAWKAERDQKYTAEEASRKLWMDRLWTLLKFIIPIGVAVLLTMLGIEALPAVPAL